MKVPAVVDHLILPLRIVIVGALIYAIVQTVLLFVFGTENKNAPDLDELQEFLMPTEVSASDIIAANLFGELPTVAVQPTIEETTLNLKLVGISYNEEDPPSSRAYIVGRSNARAVRKSVGEMVEGVAELTDIFQDHVLLLRGGKKESLFVEQREVLISTVQETTFVPELPKLADGLITQADLLGSAEAENELETTQTGWVRQYYETYHERIEEEPDEVLDEIGITPVAQESAAGYRLQDTMAERLGVRTGDILLSVNGYKVGNVQEDLARFGDHLDAKTLKLEIQRGETKITLNYKPSQ